MNKKVLKTVGFTILGFLAVCYVMFLAMPLLVNAYLKSHNAEIVEMLEKASGFKAVLSEIKLVTTPKLTAGVKLGRIEIAPAGGDNIFTSDGFEIKLSLIPLLARKIELDKISLENSKIFLAVKKDGHFVLEDYLKNIPSSQAPASANTPASSGLPFGFKLSNQLPDIYLTKVNIEFSDIDSGKKYYLDASKFNLSDFVFNKKVKIVSDGAVYLDGTKHFSYDVKIKNRIMPDMDLNDLVFAQTDLDESTAASGSKSSVSYSGAKTSTSTAAATSVPVINVIDIFDAIHTNKLAANLKADVETYGSLKDFHYYGYIYVDGITIAVDGKELPEGVVNVELKQNKAKISATLHPAGDENFTVFGTVKTGKKPGLSAHIVANAGIANIINLVDSVAKSIGIKDLDTLSGTGNIDANFNITGDKNKITSSGYFKIPSASLNYKLYNILIDKIKADVSFSDNNVNIKDVSFTVFNQPLNFYGTISDSAEADLHLTADKLLIKALVAAAGQITLLKENNFKSGTLTMDASLKGKLSAPVPSVSLAAEDLDIKNIPSDTRLTLDNAVFDLSAADKSYKGLLNINSAKVISPFATVKAPKAEVTVNEKDIKIDNAYIMIDNSRIDITGSVQNYADAEDISINLNARGSLVAADVLNMIPADFRGDMSAKGKLPLNVSITGNMKQQVVNGSVDITPDNYVSILDVDLLKNKPASVRTTMTLANDALKISDTGLRTGGVDIASVSGTISSLSKKQNMSLYLNVPGYASMPIPMMGKNSTIKVKGNLTAGGTLLNPTLKGVVSVPVIEIPDMLVKLENMDVTLGGALANGKGTLQKLTSGGIVAENLAADFTLNPNTFVLYLKNITGTAFKGKIGGDVSYNIMNGKIGADFKGTGLDAVSAIYGAAGIKNALTGTLDFTANVTTSGATDVDMIKNLKGSADFDIKNGAFAGIGRIETLLAAKNITSNIILKTAVAALSTVPVINESANFDYLKGSMTFNNGWANLSSITSSGANVAYYLTGKYNILNGSADVIILGRLSSDVVGVLGALGELSVDKLTSYIPKFGTLTANIIKTVTADPENEKTELIPQLSGEDTVYKDFKVDFNGGVESSSSVKSFKWLSNPDMSEIETTTLKEQVQEGAENVKQNIKNNVETLKNAKEQASENLKNKASELKEQSEQAKEDIKNQVQNVKDSVNELKNLFKKPSSTQEPAVVPETPAAEAVTAPAAESVTVPAAETVTTPAAE